MLQQTIELLRLDDRTGEEKVFLRRVVREHITLDALKKKSQQAGSQVRCQDGAGHLQQPSVSSSCLSREWSIRSRGMLA